MFRFHTRGRTNHLAFVRLMWSYVELSSTCSSRGRGKSSWKNRFSRRTNIRQFVREKCVRPVCTSDDMFVWDDCSSSSVKTDIWRRCFFLDGEKPEYSEKNPRNQEQTQTTYGMAPGRNRTRATLVGVTPYNSQNVLICEVYWLQGCALLIYRYNSYGVPS